MCGIAGFFGKADVAEARIRNCLAAMAHRGPDGSGVHREVTPGGHHVILLHTRLAIIDIDPRSNQPFQQGPLSIVYNGEIYNYLEVREQLRTSDPQSSAFRSEGDTEVLARQLEKHWIDGLDACEGMWAFAAWDRDRGSLLLSRDRFGEKPLYLLQRPEGIYFGSEIKFLIALSGFRPAPNMGHLCRYLVNGYKALYKQNETFYEGISELPRGSVLELHDNDRETRRTFWNPLAARPDASLTYDEAVTHARELLIKSVKLRLRADVPLAFCLSGGVDSNAIIAIARKIHGYDVHGFTIMNRDSRYEERDMVETSVRELGLAHTPVDVDNRNFLGRLQAQVRQHDGPVSTITYYAHAMLMEAIRNAGYKVSVSGTAADELFSGYYDHHAFYLADVAGMPAVHKEALANWQRDVQPIVRNPYLQDPAVFQKAPGERRHIYLDAEEFRSFLRRPWAEDFREENYYQTPLRNRMLNELFHEAVPPILHEDDLNAMTCSIENRSPFLDRPLYEFMLTVPTQHLIRNGRAKAILRDAVRGIAPEAVIDNPRKVGFNVPIEDFLDTSARDVREYLLDDSPVYDLLDRKGIETVLSQRGLPNSKSKFLFYFINAKMFLEDQSADLAAGAVA